MGQRGTPSGRVYPQSTEHTEGIDQGRYFSLAIGKGVGEVGVNTDGRDEDSKLGCSRSAGVTGIEQRHTENPANYQTGKVELVLETCAEEDKSEETRQLADFRRLLSRLPCSEERKTEVERPETHLGLEYTLVLADQPRCRPVVEAGRKIQFLSFREPATYYLPTISPRIQPTIGLQ